MSSPSTNRPSSGQSKPKDLTSTLMEKNMINMARPSMNQMRPGKVLYEQKLFQKLKHEFSQSIIVCLGNPAAMPSSNSMSNLGGLGPQMASSASFNSFGQKAILPSNSMMTPMNINSNNPSKDRFNLVY